MVLHIWEHIRACLLDPNAVTPAFLTTSACQRQQAIQQTSLKDPATAAAGARGAFLSAAAAAAAGVRMYLGMTLRSVTGSCRRPVHVAAFFIRSMITSFF